MPIEIPDGVPSMLLTTMLYTIAPTPCQFKKKLRTGVCLK